MEAAAKSISTSQQATQQNIKQKTNLWALVISIFEENVVSSSIQQTTD